MLLSRILHMLKAILLDTNGWIEMALKIIWKVYFEVFKIFFIFLINENTPRMLPPSRWSESMTKATEISGSQQFQSGSM